MLFYFIWWGWNKIKWDAICQQHGPLPHISHFASSNERDCNTPLMPSSTFPFQIFHFGGPCVTPQWPPHSIFLPRLSSALFSCPIYSSPQKLKVIITKAYPTQSPLNPRDLKAQRLLDITQSPLVTLNHSLCYAYCFFTFSESSSDQYPLTCYTFPYFFRFF